MANLSVVLTAKIKKFQRNLKTAKKDLKTFESAAKDTASKADKSTDKIDEMAESFVLSATSAAALVTVLGFVGAELFRVATKANSAVVAQKTLNAVLNKGAANASARVTTLQTLVRIAQDENDTRERRTRAIKELQRIYPNYLRNINLENAASEKTKKQIDLLTESIIRNAKIKGISGQIAKTQAKIYEEEAKTWFQRADAADLFYTLLTKGAGASTAATSALTSINREGDNAQVVLKRLNEELERLISNSLNGPQITPKLTKPKGALSTGTRFSGPTPDTSELFDIFAVTEQAQDRLTQKTTNFFIKLNNQYKSGWEAVRATTVTNQGYFVEILEDFNNQANNIITGSIVATFQELSNAVAQSLVEGGNVFAAIGGALLKSFSRFLSQMGAALIQYGVLAKMKGNLDLAIIAGGPVAIGAGIAAIKVGAALVAAGAAFGAIASGGLGGGRGSNIGGQGSVSQNISTTGGIQTFSNDGTVVFEIEGQKLVGVLNRTLQRNKRLGGTNTIG